MRPKLLLWMLLVCLAWPVSGCGGYAMKSPDEPSPIMAESEGAADYAGGGEMAAAKRKTMDYRTAQRGPASPAPPPPPRPGSMPPKPADPQPALQPTDKPPPSEGSGTVQQKIAPMLIYTAQLNMAVFEVKKSVEAVHKLAESLGGYLVHRTERSITVRVPAGKYRGALDDIAKIGDVTHREETVEDVTEQFLDMQTRLKNLRAMRDRFQQLLEKATTVKDALEVEKELGRVTSAIEQIEGKLKRLRELVSFSTITVEFAPHPSQKVRSKVRLPFPWLNNLGLPRLLNL